MTCNIIFQDNSTAVGSEADWRTVLASGADCNGKPVHNVILFDGDAHQAQWRDGMLWIYNDTANGIDPLV